MPTKIQQGIRKAWLTQLTKAAKATKGKGTGKRRPKTAAEKKLLSDKLKAAWKRRKSSEKKAAAPAA
jgi:hypothetical protein